MAVARMRGGVGERPFGFMRQGPIGRICGGEGSRGMGMGSDRFEGRGENAAQGMKPFFGSVVRVEGNRIVIQNNGAQEQVIVSQAETEIVVGNREIPLAALANAGNILVRGIGSMGRDGTMTAKTIVVLP